MSKSPLLIAVVAVVVVFVAACCGAQDLQERLANEDPAALAAAAHESGDARRGALLFYQPHLACANCHSQLGGTQLLGPDLAKRDDKATDQYLVESLLHPSKVIKKGYESTTVITTSGMSVTGLVSADSENELVLRDASQAGELVSVPKSDIDERVNSTISVMPANLANQLANRGQFLDLVRYLFEIADGGPVRERELRPPSAQWTLAAVPDYEKNIDHAGLIGEADRKSFARGKAIYHRLCVNCHGTPEKAGSLPTSLRFASGTFKNGSDPYSMYRTLTYGFGQMVRQAWMVPQQKYDVIHYIREAYLKRLNRTQYFRLHDDYLASLPTGDSRGPEPSALEPWSTMDYGPHLIATYEIGNDGTNFAYKGIAVRLDAGPGGVAKGRHWMLFDHDTLRMAGAWSGEGFIDFEGIMFNGRHEVHPHVVGHVHAANPVGPGWAGSEGAGFEDVRLHGRDGRPYGPLPRDWAKYRGLYQFGQQTVLSYTVGETDVLELPGLITDQPRPVFSRTFNIGPRDKDMVLQVAHHRGDDVRLQHLTSGDSAGVVLFGRDLARPSNSAVGDDGTSSPDGEAGEILVAGLWHAPDSVQWSTGNDGDLRLTLPAGAQPLNFTLWFSSVDDSDDAAELISALEPPTSETDLSLLTAGGPPRWPTKLTTVGVAGSDEGPFAVDVLTLPDENPWLCRVRPTGFDFFADGKRMAVCTWDGDVWLVDGIETPEAGLVWQRIASGLFQPLGLKIVDGQIYVTCRDQIVILHDLNGDGETDFYQNFNNDHQVTEHFHEFAMGLQTDKEGNFYYAKSARHAKTALVPHHGTLLRVSKDGSRTDIVATGFRAANGVCVNGDGTFIVTDQEGHWNPKNRINWVTPGGFYGNMWGYHDVTDTSDDAMEQPLCWITNSFDRSPAELLWVDSERWGPLNGALLNLSYGYGKVFVVPYEEIDGQKQGGMCELPIPQFPTGLIRGRFHPVSGQLYVCGMFAWAGNQQQPGGLYRIRYTGKPVRLPIGLAAKRSGMHITFTDALDRAAATDPANYAVKTWSLKRTAEYGSDHYNEKPAKIISADLSADGKSVRLEIADMRPTWCMEIRYNLKAADGTRVDGVIHNTVHNLADD